MIWIAVEGVSLQDSMRRRLVLAVVGAVCMPATVLGGEPDLADHVAKVIEWRGSAESWVRKIKARKQLSAIARSGAQDRYDDARTGFEAWRFALRTDLAQRTEASSAFQKERLRIAAEKAAAFIGYAEGVLSRGGAAASSSRLISTFVGDVGDFALRAMELFAKGSSEKRQEIGRILDELEWRRFDTI